MAQLEVSEERETLRHADVGEGLEDHHRDGVAGQDVADDELRENLKGDRLVRDGANHADGDEEREGDDEREDERPDRHLRVVNLQ